MRQVSVDARGKDNRVEQFKVVTTILDPSVGGGQIGDLYERRWLGEIDIRSIKATMRMDVLRCKTPEIHHALEALPRDVGGRLLAAVFARTNAGRRAEAWR
jgi:hypothetical protein